MHLEIYQIDAFAEQVFGGNPAAVCPLEKWLPDGLMQSIAAENNLSETAFIVATQGGYHIRWFTPTTEVRLCGHATLASAWVCFNELGYPHDTLAFESLSGELTVTRDGERLSMNFPAQICQSAQLPDGLLDSLGIELAESDIECLQHEDYLLVLPSADDVAALQPDFTALQRVKTRGVVVTAPAGEFDFVCRFFGPAVGVNEDPVTGSAFTKLIPYWSERLGKQRLIGKQISARGGIVQGQANGARVTISGSACLYLKGMIEVDG